MIAGCCVWRPCTRKIAGLFEVRPAGCADFDVQLRDAVRQIVCISKLCVVQLHMHEMAKGATHMRCVLCIARYLSVAGVATHNVECWQVNEPLGCEESKESCCHVADHHWLVLCLLKLHSRGSSTAWVDIGPEFKWIPQLQEHVSAVMAVLTPVRMCECSGGWWTQDQPTAITVRRESWMCVPSQPSCSGRHRSPAEHTWLNKVPAAGHQPFCICTSGASGDTLLQGQAPANAQLRTIQVGTAFSSNLTSASALTRTDRAAGWNNTQHRRITNTVQQR